MLGIAASALGLAPFVRGSAGPEDAPRRAPVLAPPLPARTSAPASRLVALEAAPERRASPGEAATTADPAPPAPPPPEPSGRAAAHDAATDSRTAGLDVVVVDARTGAPVPSATVEVWTWAQALDPDDPGVASFLRTDRAGRVAARLEPGDARVAAWSGSLASGSRDAVLIAGDRQRVELALEPALPVGGVVRDARTGRGIPDARVSFWTVAEGDVVRTETDGRFLHPRFPPGDAAQQVRVEASGYAPTTRYLEVRPDGRWDAPSALGDAPAFQSGPAWIEVALVPELVVQGLVTDAAGEPIAAAEVLAEGYVYVLPSVASSDGARGRTGEDGAFELRGLRSDVGHSLLVRAPGRAELLLELPAAESHELGELRLEPERVMAGVVVDADGHPVEGVRVALVVAPEVAAHAESDPATLDAGLRRIAGLREETTATDGTFVFDGLAPGRYEVAVARDGDPLLEEEVALVGTIEPDDLLLRLPPDVLVLEGTIQRDGRAVEGVRVELSRFGPVGAATTDAEGRFRIAGLDAEAAYDLVATGRCPRTGTPLVAEASVWGYDHPTLRLGEE